MPPVSKKNCSVILFDLKTTNFESAKQLLLKIASTKFFTSCKDLTKLILLNCEKSENSGDYQNILEVSEDPEYYNPRKFLEFIEKYNSDGEVNWLEGLALGAQYLAEHFIDIGGIVTYQLVFITDFPISLPNSRENDLMVKKIVKYLERIQGYLYVMGPHVDFPSTLKNPTEVWTWMNIIEEKCHQQDFSYIWQIRKTIKKTLICDFRLAQHLFSVCKNWTGTQPWIVPLTIGTKLEFPTKTMRILTEGMTCKAVRNYNSYAKTVFTEYGNPTKEIESSQIVEVIKRHGKCVKISDSKMFQLQNPRSFTVLCFTKSENVPELLMRGDGCYCVLPNGTREDGQILDVLIDRLVDQKKYIIARRIYNANNIPRLVVLVPKPDHKPKCFFLCNLPYSDDILSDYIEESPEKAPSVKIIPQVFSYLDSININNTNCLKQIPLSITMMKDENTQRTINKATDKYLEAQLKLHQLDLVYWQNISTGEDMENLKVIWKNINIEEMKNENPEDNFNW